MPELPEVETTTKGLRKNAVGLFVRDVWTDLSSKDARKKNTVSDPKYFSRFRKEVRGGKIISAGRRAKNILINLSGGKTILVHMKMTGHLLYGKYVLRRGKWLPAEDGPLQDPFNRFIHVVFSLSNEKHLAFSDARKFGKITLLDTKTARESAHLAGIGPEPLGKKFTLEKFKERLRKKSNGKIKSVLTDQSVIAGIGNIYSDEILWLAGIAPKRKVSEIKEGGMKKMFEATKEILAKGVNLGGDSMSDYRNIRGLPGKFQAHHEVYRRTGEHCGKRGCAGIIEREVIGGRSAHSCPKHQK